MRRGEWIAGIGSGKEDQTPFFQIYCIEWKCLGSHLLLSLLCCTSNRSYIFHPLPLARIQAISRILLLHLRFLFYILFFLAKNVIFQMQEIWLKRIEWGRRQMDWGRGMGRK